MLSKISFDLSPVFQNYKTYTIFKPLKSGLFAEIKTMLSKTSLKLSSIFQNYKTCTVFKTLKSVLFQESKTMLSKILLNLPPIFKIYKAQLFFKTFKGILFLVLSLVFILSSPFTLAEENKSSFTNLIDRIQTDGQKIINFSEEVLEGERLILSPEDRKQISDWIQGVELNFPKSLALKGNLVDLSPVIKELDRLKSADIDNRLNLINVTNLLQDKYLEPLCEKSKSQSACLDQASLDLSQSMSSISDALRGRDLDYPDDEYHLTKDYRLQLLDETDKNKDSEQELYLMGLKTMNLDLSCPSNCSHENWFKMMAFGPSSQYENLKPKIKQADKTCKRQILESIISPLRKMLFPAQCFELKKNELTPRCVNNLKTLETLRKRIADLIPLVYGEQDSYKTSAATLCIDCLLREGKTHKDIVLFMNSDFRDSVQEREECLDLKPGEKKQIDPRGRLPYTLKRSKEGGYEIDFPLVFFATEDYDGATPPETVPNIYRDRVQKCLKQANKRLLGPEGEKLKISLSRPRTPVKNSENKGECPSSPIQETIPIGIGSSNHRPDSSKYNSDIDCSAITHEILHLTGLCDEYKENKKGYYTDPETGEVVSCDTRTSDTKAQCKPKYDCRVVAENSIMSIHQERWEYAEENNKSLLSPGQFKKILYGSCPGKNEIFNQCSDLAYKSSNEEEACHTIRDKCAQENGMGLNKQEQIDFLEAEIKEQQERLDNAELGIANPDQRFYTIDGKKVYLSEIIANPKNYEEYMNPYYRRDRAQKKIQSAKEKLELIKSWPDL